MPENWAVKHLLQELSKPKLPSKRDDYFTSLNMEQFSLQQSSPCFPCARKISVTATKIVDDSIRKSEGRLLN